MKYFKRIVVLTLVTALTITLFTTGKEASAFTKTQYGLTLKGGSSLSRNKGSAWGSVSPRSYVSVASTYRYKSASGVPKTVNTDRTGAGDSSGASWSYTLPGGYTSVSLDTNWTGIYNYHSVVASESLVR